MLQIVLIIIGIFYFVRRPKIARLTAADMPAIPPETLEQWKQLELKSIDWFLWATWGVSVLGTILGLMIQRGDSWQWSRGRHHDFGPCSWQD